MAITVEDLYRQYAGREADPGGLAFWQQGFGSDISPEEVASFQRSVAETRAQGSEPQATVAPETNAPSLVDQILGSSNTSAWTGEGFGSAKANAEDMAKVLNRAGITDVGQLGVRTVEVPAVMGYTDSGQEFAIQGPTVAQEYYNKATGQAVEPSYDRAGGNIFSGTFKGKDSTSYGVQFDASGKPVFYTQQGASTSDMGQIAPFLALGALAFGAGGGFEGLFGAGAGTAGAAGLTAEQLALVNALGGAEVAGGLTAAQAASLGLGGGFGTLTGLTAAQIAAMEGLGGAEVAGGLTAAEAGAAGLGGGFSGTAGLLSGAGMTTEQIAAMEGLGGAEVAGGLTAAEAAAAGLGGGFTGLAAGGLTAAELAAVNGLGGAEVAGGLTAAEAGAAGLGGGFTGAATGALAGLTPSQIANLVKAGVGLLGAGGAVSAVGNGGGSNTVLQAPTQKQPEYTPGYYNQLQQYYNSYLPQTPRDVVTPLQQWYNSSYGA